MSKLQGTVVADAVVPLGANATHYDNFGQGGFRSVTTLAERDAIAAGDSLDPDGISSGLRKVGMLVFVAEEVVLYQLSIPGFLDMPDTERLVALGDNLYWEQANLGGGGTGSSVVDFRFDEAANELTIETTDGIFTLNLSSLNPPQLVTSVNTKVGDVVLGKADVGLGNVNNTSDIQKPISTATQAALDQKADKNQVGDTLTGVTLNPTTKVLTVATDKTSKSVDLSPLVTAQSVTSVNGKTGAVVITKADVGLSLVDNTPDVQKPISTATQAALDQKANKTEVVTLENFAQTFVNKQDGGSEITTQVSPAGNILQYLTNGIVKPWHISDAAVALNHLQADVQALLNARGDTIQGLSLQGTTLTLTTDQGTKVVDLSSLAGTGGGGQQAAPAFQKLSGTLDATLSGPIPAGALGVLALVVRNGYTFLSQDYTVNTQAGTFTIINDTQDLVAGDAFEVIGIMSAPEGGGGTPAEPSLPYAANAVINFDPASQVTQDENNNVLSWKNSGLGAGTLYYQTVSPTLEVSSVFFGGEPVINFSTASGFQNYATDPTYLTGPENGWQDMTVVMVQQFTGDGSGDPMMFGFERIDLWMNSQHLGLNTYGGDNYGSVPARAAVFNPSVVACTISAGNYAGFKLYINGTNMVLENPGNYGNQTIPNNFTLFRGREANQYHWTGRLAQCVVFNRILTPAEVAEVSLYFKTKFNL